LRHSESGSEAGGDGCANGEGVDEGLIPCNRRLCRGIKSFCFG
jgi:hypothetical protein